MGEETNRIRQHIDDEREDLGRNLQEIEYRLKDATDPKALFDRNTAWVLGAAAAGGFLLALAVGKSSGSAVPSNWESGSSEHNPAIPPRLKHAVATHLNGVSETVENIFDGLVGVFSDKLQSIVADVVPGFKEQYERVKRHEPPAEQVRFMD